MVESLVLAFALSVIRLSAPMFIAGMGNMYCERVGVLNLGAEGMMVSGAFAAVLGSYLTGNPWIGVLMGVHCGSAPWNYRRPVPDDHHLFHCKKEKLSRQ